LVAYFGRGLRWLKSAEAEVERSRQWLADVSNFYNDELNHLGLIQPRPAIRQRWRRCSA